MSASLGIKSNCIEEEENEFRRWGRAFFEVKAIKDFLAMFAPKIIKTFSIPYIVIRVTKSFNKLFQDIAEYRKEDNVVRQDLINLLIQLMEKGYVEHGPDENTAEGSSKYIHMCIHTLTHARMKNIVIMIFKCSKNQ